MNWIKLVDESRPDPEKLLSYVQSQEKQAFRGHLKVFLGMAAGVGKTYAMLEEGHKLLSAGVDLVVGIVNTHGRKETENLTNGLEQVPCQKIFYKGAHFDELDLDAILKRKPACCLVDELAHTNIPGARHIKRWQDVQELLDNGIDVMTTLNVQHMESLKEIVETITGITIHETVPDSIIEEASEIEVVDITPHELLERLKEGKVYLGSQATVALNHFFKEDRLTALRELALRFTAEKVDHDLRDMVATIEQGTSWKPRERLLVAVSHSPLSQRLIRSTKRLAFLLDCPWVALHVDNGVYLDAIQNQMLDHNLTLARELGAEVVTIQDPDIAEGIERVARQKAATQIIVGRHPPRKFLGLFERTTLVDRLVLDCSTIDVHVVAQPENFEHVNRESRKIKESFSFSSYLLITIYVCLLGLANFFLEPYVGYKVVGFIFLLGILAQSLFFKTGPVIFGSILSGVIWDYFFIPPIWTFVVSSDEDMILLCLYFLTAAVTSVLANRAKEHKRLLARREATSQALYEIVREIAANPSTDKIVHSVNSKLSSILQGDCEIFLKLRDNGLDLEGSILFDEKEKAAVFWVFENGKEAGWSTATLPGSKFFYIPLQGRKEVVGVLGFRAHKPSHLTHDEKNFLHTAAQQLAYFFERTFIEERARQS